jgi:hypothetical protein
MRPREAKHTPDRYPGKAEAHDLPEQERVQEWPQAA